MNLWLNGEILHKGITYHYIARVADEPTEVGIDCGRVFKLSVVRDGEDEEIIVYERGWDVYPEDPEVEEVIDEILKLYP